MNTELENKLRAAYRFYSYQETHYYSKIVEYRNVINESKQTFAARTFPKTPAKQMEEQSIKDILLLFFIWPIGLLNMNKHKKEKKEMEIRVNIKFAEEMMVYEKFCDEIKNTIQHALSEIKRLEAERIVFEKVNGACVNFIPDSYHSYNAVGRILSYVSAGRADTMKEAINLMHEDIEREHDRELNKMYFERSMEQSKKFHEETLCSLNEIKAKQDRAAEQRRQLQHTVSNIYNEIR